MLSTSFFSLFKDYDKNIVDYQMHFLNIYLRTKKLL